MERAQIIEALQCLNQNNPLEYSGDIVHILEHNICTTCEKYQIQDDRKQTILAQLLDFKNFDDSPLSKYIELSIYFLLELKENLAIAKDEDHLHHLLDVEQTESLCNILKTLSMIGIRWNLVPNMPKFVKCRSRSFLDESDYIMKHYNRMTATTYCYFLCVKCEKMRGVILSNCFQAMLNGLYQLIYCPIKKPGVPGSFEMDFKTYGKLTREREVFRSCLNYISTIVPICLFAKKTMVLLNNNASMWFKKAVSYNLTKILLADNGLETIIIALLDQTVDYDSCDISKTWKAQDVIIKIVMSLKPSSSFKPNICRQIVNLLDVNAKNHEYRKPFETIFILCVKTLYYEDRDLCEKTFMGVLLEPLINLINTSDKYKDGDNITEILFRTIRLLHAGFAGNNANNPDLPLNILTPVVSVIFRLFGLTVTTSSLNGFNRQLNQLLIKYSNENRLSNSQLFESLFFGITNAISNPRKNIELEANQFLLKNKYQHDINKSGEDLLKLYENEGELLVDFFIFLLNSLSSKKYFETEHCIERQLAVYNLLANLSENKTIQTHINKDPKCVVDYIQTVLHNAIEIKIYLSQNSEGYQSLFVTLMLLQSLTSNCDDSNLDCYKNLIESLQLILTQCDNDELRNVVSDIIGSLESTKRENGEMSELDRIIEDVCDPLLPIRGHGLMELAKLVEKKDKDALERKMFILNIFEQNLKNEDSYIYLSAINGLAAMGDVVPEVVLKSLVSEYLDFNKKDDGSVGLRMKVGEVLVRITKKMEGDVVNHKSLLLNCFLTGSKDEDNLIRASALSNLGEVCRVLGYKLGTIVEEILECVHSVITTEKAVEARRAAVTVIRQLFVGLESETINFLKDDIVEIYRSLKDIYYNDKDDVMRLQAQLALEELNENVKKFVFGSSEISFEKKTVE